MNISFYYNASENNKIGKVLQNETTLTGSLRHQSFILKPEILVEASTLEGFNYAYIPEFNRYYFITEIISYRTNLWIVRLDVDVLESFKTDILNLSCIINSTEGYMGDNYLTSESWVNKVKAKTDILQFQNGLLNSGEYILITAGG